MLKIKSIITTSLIIVFNSSIATSFQNFYKKTEAHHNISLRLSGFLPAIRLSRFLRLGNTCMANSVHSPIPRNAHEISLSVYTLWCASAQYLKTPMSGIEPETTKLTI